MEDAYLDTYMEDYISAGYASPNYYDSAPYGYGQGYDQGYGPDEDYDEYDDPFYDDENYEADQADRFDEKFGI